MNAPNSMTRLFLHLVLLSCLAAAVVSCTIPDGDLPATLAPARLAPTELPPTPSEQPVRSATGNPTDAQLAATGEAETATKAAEETTATAMRLETEEAAAADTTPITSTPPACLMSGGRMVLDSLRSDKLKLPMEYRVWLPPCYDQEMEQRYPVLYMIHGQNYNEDQWDRLGIDETAEALIAAGELPPFLIVMPRDRNWSQPTEDPFGEVLVEELVPLIDANYRTIPKREARAVGGLSRGAGWAVHLGFSRWDLFGAIGAHSLPVFWTDTPKIHRWMEEMPFDQRPRIYLDIGDRDRPQILESARWFEELLTKRGFAHVWHLFPGYHEEKYWESHVEQYLRWYAQPWWEP